MVIIKLVLKTNSNNMDYDKTRGLYLWFAEKDPKKGANELYPLDDFSVRKTENTQKGYLNGIYGAIPFVVTGDTIAKVFITMSSGMVKYSYDSYRC